MDFLDFLSEPPNLFIFQKKTNQNFVGGILFLIYILVMILISLVYILNYALNEKYTYEALTFYNNIINSKEKEEMDKDDELNPYLNFSINLNNDNIGFYDNSNKENITPIAMEKTYDEVRKKYIYNFSKKVSDINIMIYFLCGEDENCELIKDNKTNNCGSFTIKYPYHFIDHEKDPPVNESTFWTLNQPIIKNNDKVYLRTSTYEWEIIKYKDQKSLFDIFTKRKSEYIFGKINSTESTSTEFEFDDPKVFHYLNGTGYAIFLYSIRFINKQDEYIYYKRTKVSFLDVIASIGALFSTVKFFFSLLFSFYSKNFDNYKILENILTPPKKPIKPIVELSTEIKLPVDTNKEEEKNDNTDKNKKEPFIGSVPENNKDVNDNKENNLKINSVVLNELCCCEYVFNNFYCKCCKKYNSQDLINKVKDITYEYLSMERLLYNQILLENLIKDYRWNNPALNDIQNSEVIIKLRNG